MSLSDVITRQLRIKGRPMVLRRRVGTGESFLATDVQGYLVSFSPQEIIGAVQMGDSRVTLAPFTGTIDVPRANDMLHIDGVGWRIMGVTSRKVGTVLAGWTLWLRGGGGK
jgi:hypothetical protein